MKKLLHTIVLFIVVLLPLSCVSRNGYAPLFKDASIQDSLVCFLERIDSIPNSYGAPSLYVVSFWLTDQDSLIRFSANSALWEYSTFEIDTTSIDHYIGPPPAEVVDSVLFRSPNWIGLYQCGEKYVLVESDWDPSAIIYMSSLGPWDDFERLYHYEDPMQAPDCDLTHYRYHCSRTYLYHSPNKMRLISRRIGKADPDFKDYPETIEY